jgi:hypothetical protein
MSEVLTMSRLEQAAMDQAHTELRRAQTRAERRKR